MCIPASHPALPGGMRQLTFDQYIKASCNQTTVEIVVLSCMFFFFLYVHDFCYMASNFITVMHKSDANAFLFRHCSIQGA